ncbi:hypothetical protein QBC35DRAFT_375780 [Podospora australis]|uniref:Uncharacterized protein n=1 Tax=Podospora australis TaxID=1536484 RepID=A0AAN6WZS4_9PEZI|nr:hypothetical protein QBC35DRAFT_375780 [Podospora australis]
MVNYRLFAFAGLVAALPLNINLGAYSPALVVGDGEISFGGKQDVSNLMNALEGAAVDAASGAAGSSHPLPAAPASEVSSPTSVEAAAAPAADPALSQQAAQIAALQGMGKKQIAPRDLAGFDRALTYSEAALVKGPKVELGTGAEGAGVGIIVDNNAAQAKKKRDVAAADESDADSSPRRRSKVTTLYVRRGVPAALQGNPEEEEDITASVMNTAPPAPAAPAQEAAAEPTVAKRDAGLDAVNLNVDGDAGVTMTFVETFDDDDDE